MVNTLLLAALLVAGLTGERRAEPGPADTGQYARTTIPFCADGGRSTRGSASFVVVDSSAARHMHFGEGNLVFCRTTSATMVWVRFAVSADNDGNDSAHLDLDVCNLSGGGAFRPMEARARPCPGGMTWAAWWHDESGRVYASRAGSSPCELQLEVQADRLTGTFSCNGLVTEDGAATIDLADGRFECALEGSAHRSS
jgi:hypothetical protein